MKPEDKELTTAAGKSELWVEGNSEERRNSPRLALTRDLHSAVILRIKLPCRWQPLKSFAENISSGGLCFNTSKELDDKQPVNLRLFFYGEGIPNFRAQAWIVWKRAQDSKNWYGIAFDGLDEKVKTQLQYYIEV